MLKQRIPQLFTLIQRIPQLFTLILKKPLEMRGFFNVIATGFKPVTG